MIDKSKIKKGLIFWNNCESIIQIPNCKIYINPPVGLMEIEKIHNDNYVLCSIYNKEYFGAQTALTVDYIEKHAIEITLDDTDWQEMVDLCNTISFEKTKKHDWSAKVPDSLKERVNNFLCRDFYLKYNLVKSSTGDAETFRAITNKMCNTFEVKNHDYGNSFHKLFEECGITYAYGHMAEKLERINSLRKNEAKVKGESMKDSLYDLANYAILTIMELEKAEK